MEHKIKDQKVSIKLSSVTALQKRYQRAQRAYHLASENYNASQRSTEQIRANVNVSLAAAKARMEAFQEAIALMELPIS